MRRTHIVARVARNRWEHALGATATLSARVGWTQRSSDPEPKARPTVRRTSARNRCPCQVSHTRRLLSSDTKTAPNTTGLWSTLVSARELAALEERLCDAVASSVIDPIVQQPLSQLQWLVKRIVATESNSDTPRITLQLLVRPPSLLHPSLPELKQRIRTEALVQLQEWVAEKRLPFAIKGASPLHGATIELDVNVEALPSNRPVPMMARLVEDTEDLLANLGPGLQSVAHYVAVYSCKGGVGKSTVAVNLAYELAQQWGGRVGVLDLDLYGPSLPILVHVSEATIRRSPLGSGMVYPIVHERVKLLSLGFVNTHSGVPGSGQENGAAVMKGPMAVKVVSQLLKGTDWGDLDVLILDLPPGTGDVQLAVLQQLQLSGAVAVTTPSKLAVADTRKGMEMFTSLGVPTLAIVENMSYFRDDSGAMHYPFGKGVTDEGRVDFANGVEVVRLPISVVANDANDNGVPLTLLRPSNATVELNAYRDLARVVSKELLLLQYGSNTADKQLVAFESNPTQAFDVATVTLSLDKTIKGAEKFVVRLLSEETAIQLALAPSQLRSRNPKTGDLMLESPFFEADADTLQDDPMVMKTRKRSPSIIPTKVERRGRYGFAVEWGDGATIIYSMMSLARAAGGDVKQEKL